jgi:hypothetical protein
MRESTKLGETRGMFVSQLLAASERRLRALSGSTAFTRPPDLER